MDTTETITTHTTGDALYDEAIAYICAFHAYKTLYAKRTLGAEFQYDRFLQDAFLLMNLMDPSKIAYDEHSRRYYPRYEKRGKPPLVMEAGVYE